MRVVSFFVVLIVLLLIILLSIRFRVMILFDSNSKCAYYSLCHRFASLLQGKVLLLEDGKISFISNKMKILDKKLPKLQEKILISKIIKATKINHINIYTYGSVTKDSFVSAMFGGVSNCLGGIICTLAKNKNIRITIKNDDYITDTPVSVAVNLNIKISLLGALYALIYSKIKYLLTKGEKVNEAKIRW